MDEREVFAFSSKSTIRFLKDDNVLENTLVEDERSICIVDSDLRDDKCPLESCSSFAEVKGNEESTKSSKRDLLINYTVSK